MFCPKCAAQNTDDAKFCRACGADISLVSQAVSGQLAERLNESEREIGLPAPAPHKRKQKEPPSIEQAVRSIFMGLGFIFMALAVKTWMPGGFTWWFWMFIPAFVFLGDGIGTYLRVREHAKRLAPPDFAPAQQPPSLPPQRVSALPRRDTGELLEQTPPSVTEATTRHLAMPVERKPKDV